MEVIESRNCFGCNKLLIEPYLCCSECLPPLCYICLTCYSRGKEFGLHENSHPYKIIRNNFSILEPDWTAAEELKLLNGIGKFGLGNWAIVGHFVSTKTKEECRKHYFKCYVYSPREELPKFPEIQSLTPVRATPIPIKSSENPPRPSTTVASREIADYMPGRGDFGYEFDNYAELDLKNCEFDPETDELETELHLAAVTKYNSRLKERARRKWIAREHGLINTRSNFLFSLRYCKIIPNLFDKLLPFAHLLTGDSFVYFLESLIVEVRLKQKIQQLKEYRRMGITHHDSVPTYLSMKKKRQEFANKKNPEFLELVTHITEDPSLKTWIKKKVNQDHGESSESSSMIKQKITRKSAPPLEIQGMPSYDKLSPRERTLCSALRLLPTSFLVFKGLLINASDKFGGIKLVQARQLVKIDVNKTKKIFDLLVEEGMVRKNL